MTPVIGTVCTALRPNNDYLILKNLNEANGFNCFVIIRAYELMVEIAQLFTKGTNLQSYTI